MSPCESVREIAFEFAHLQSCDSVLGPRSLTCDLAVQLRGEWVRSPEISNPHSERNASTGLMASALRAGTAAASAATARRIYRHRQHQQRVPGPVLYPLGIRRSHRFRRMSRSMQPTSSYNIWWEKVLFPTHWVMQITGQDTDAPRGFRFMIDAIDGREPRRDLPRSHSTLRMPA